VDFDEIELCTDEFLNSKDFEIDEEDNFIPSEAELLNPDGFYGTLDTNAAVNGDIELSDIESGRKFGTQSNYDDTITGIGTMPLKYSDNVGNATRRASSEVSGVVSKREFSLRIRLLANHRKWVEKAARK
jgi:hypothetical protein